MRTLRRTGSIYRCRRNARSSNAVPSGLLPEEEADVLAPSPVAGSLGGARRGTLVHRLLELLPDLPYEARRAQAMQFLQRRCPEVGAGELEGIVQSVLDVLNDPRFREVFGDSSLAEVPIAGVLRSDTGNTVNISGQIDRLCIENEKVLIVDFKSNQRVPSSVSEVPRAYLLQMAAYRMLLRLVYPGRTVEAALLWTSSATLMPLPDASLDVIPVTEIAGFATNLQ